LTVAGYALAALLLFVVFVFLTLPADAIGRRLVRQVEAAAGVRIHVVAVDRLYPLGLRWQGVSIDQPGGQREWMNFSSVSVEPEWTSLLSRRKVMLIGAKRADGVIEGQVAVGQLPSAPSGRNGLRWRVDLTRVEGVDLAMLQPLLPEVKTLSGRLSGNLSYEWDSLEPLYGTGTMFVDVQKLMLSGAVLSMVPVDKLEFDQATCGLALKDGRATISNCSARGPQGQVEVSGTAQLQLPVSRTMLDLRAEVKWQGLGGGPLEAEVSGPIGSPDVMMDGGVTIGTRGGDEGGPAGH